MSCSNDNAAADDVPETLAFDPETIETVEGLWMNAGASQPLASCYSEVLREAGVLAEPVETMTDLADAHNSLSSAEQAELDACLATTEPVPESADNTVSKK